MKKTVSRKRLSLDRKYRVQAELSNVELVKAKSALRLVIFERGEQGGEIAVGQGSLYWYGAHKQRPRRIAWGTFAEMMDKLAYGHQ